MTAAFEPVALDDFLLKLFPNQHISVSAVKQHTKCPEQFRRVKLLGHKARPSAAMEWGSSDHETAGHNYAQKIQSEKDLPVSEVQEFFVNEWETRVEGLGGPGEIDWEADKKNSLFAGKSPEQGVAIVKDKGVQLVKTYHEQMAKDLFPLSVEEEIFFQPEGMPLPIKGFIDVVAERRGNLFDAPLNVGPMILERKTRGSLRAPKPEDRFQAKVYQLAKPFPAEFHISSRPTNKVGRFDADPIEQPEITVRSLRAALVDMATNYALYGVDQPWPDRGRLHDWACDFCAFKASCPWWHPEFWPGKNGEP